MVKTAWGTKRICLKCSNRFYDLNQNPATCPKCQYSFDPTQVRLRRRTKRAPVEETQTDELLKEVQKKIETRRKTEKLVGEHAVEFETEESTVGDIENADDDLEEMEDLDEVEVIEELSDLGGLGEIEEIGEEGPPMEKPAVAKGSDKKSKGSEKPKSAEKKPLAKNQKPAAKPIKPSKRPAKSKPKPKPKKKPFKKIKKKPVKKPAARKKHKKKK